MTALHPAAPPERVVLDGRYVRLEPLAAHHAADLLAASAVPDKAERFAYLPSDPPENLAAMQAWIAAQQGLVDPMLYALIDKTTGRAGGWQQFMRIVPEHGVIEVGYVYWGPAIARTRLATEAIYLFARHAFETLGYRRFEWKCNNLNLPSRRAAERFGFTFEGVFRQHMITRGKNRDTAWFSMLDSEWPARKAGFDAWLAPENFAADGGQREKLQVWGGGVANSE